MANVFDYIKWRGDLSFRDSEFNEIDNLVLSAVSYFPFDKIMDSTEKITLKEAYDRYSKNKENIFFNGMQKEDINFFPKVAQSKRFGELYVMEYENKFDEKEEKQFAAITIMFQDYSLYISYKGTDNTLVGWKEDFNMSFMESVPSQIDALNYLERVSKKTFTKIRIGGHSKGGNLAIYASAFCNKWTQKRIVQIYNNDGPGFTEKIVESEEYNNILDKIVTYIPQSSIIGKLLEHKEKCIIVNSSETGIFQHNLYTWQLIGKEFEYINELSKQSEKIDKTIKQWLESVDPEKREKFIDIIYKIINETGAKTLTELTTNWLENAKTVIKLYRDIDPQEKAIILETVQILIKITKNNFINNKNLSKV